MGSDCFSPWSLHTFTFVGTINFGSLHSRTVLHDCLLEQNFMVTLYKFRKIISLEKIIIFTCTYVTNVTAIPACLAINMVNIFAALLIA